MVIWELDSSSVFFTCELADIQNLPLIGKQTKSKWKPKDEFSFKFSPEYYIIIEQWLNVLLKLICPITDVCIPICFFSPDLTWVEVEIEIFRCNLYPRNIILGVI